MQYLLTAQELEALQKAARKEPPFFQIEQMMPMKEVCVAYAKMIVERCGGNASKASKILAVHRHTVCAWLKSP
jgi:hypothetical protein